MERETTRGPHLVLVGIRGSGKTTVGRLTARRCQAPFLDTDDLVEQALGLTIPTIFARFGETGFRQAEQQVVEGLEGKKEPSVVATGGGVVLNETNRAVLRRSGLVVWLDLPPEIAAARIAGSGRPSLTGRPISAELLDIAERRRPLYEALAHVRLEASEPASVLAAKLARIWTKE